MTTLVLFFYAAITILNIFLLGKWLKSFKKPVKSLPIRLLASTLYLLLSSTLILSTFFKASRLKTVIARIGNIWFGVFEYLIYSIIIVFLVILVLRLLHRYPRRASISYKRFIRRSGLIVLGFTLLIGTYGYLNGRHMKVNTYDVSIDKQASGLDHMKIGLIADLHLGYNNGSADVEKMVRLLNKEHPDLILIAGDITDNNYDAIDSPARVSAALKKLEARFGVYGVYGNHDVTEQLIGGFTQASDKAHPSTRDKRIDDMLSAGNVTMLSDDFVMINNSIYLIGRLDAHKSGVRHLKPKTVDELMQPVDTGRPVILMEHEPIDLDEEAAAGVDLEVAGHTHGGQTFPGTILTHILWKNAWGLYKDDAFHSVVTCGVGTWGPNMRVGTDSEIAVIDVRFKK